MLRGSLSLFLIAVACSLAPAAETKRPNVLIILADDMGFSDLGCYGGEIARRTSTGWRRTACGSRSSTTRPAAGRRGRRSSPATTPSRCGATPCPASRAAARACGRRGPGCCPRCSSRSATAPTTPASGTSTASRSQNGFDHSYSLKTTTATSARAAHRGRQAAAAGRARRAATTPPRPSPTTPSSASRSTRRSTATSRSSSTSRSRPRTSRCRPRRRTSPATAKTYLAGWDATARASAGSGMQELGIVAASRSPPSSATSARRTPFPDAIKKLGPNEVNRPLPWKDLTERAAASSRRTRWPIHAAMVDRMDREIGRVLDQLRAMGACDNTLVFFLSDNGASAEIMVRGDGHDPTAAPGSAATFLCLGPGLVERGQHAVPPAQDVGARGRHLDAADRPLAAGHRRPRRTAARPGPRHRPRADDPRSGRRQTARDVERPARAAAAGQKPGAPVRTDGTVPHDYLWWLHEGNRALRVATGRSSRPARTRLGAVRPRPRPRRDEQPRGWPAEKVRELEQVWKRAVQEFTELARRDVPADAPRKKAKRKDE